MKKFIITILVFICLFSCKKSQKNTTEISLWHTMEINKQPLLKQLITEFEFKNPDIKVNVLAKGPEELRTGFQTIAAFTGGGPELVYGPMDNVGAFEAMKIKNKQSIIKPLEQVLSKEFLEKFDGKGIIKYKGKIYQIAERIGNHLALGYNKKLLKNAGIENPPTTITELIEQSKKLTIDENNDGVIDQWGFVWNYKEPFWYIPFFGSFGGRVFDENNKPTLNTEAAINAFKLIKKMRDEHKIMPQECDYNIADNLFNQGNAAFIINGDWSWQKYEESKDVDFGIVPIPYNTKTKQWASPMVSATGYSLNSNAKGKKLKAAIKLLKYLTNEYVQASFSKKFKSIPSLKTLLNNKQMFDDEIFKASIQQIKYGQTMPIIPEMRAAWDAMRPALQNVLGNAQTSEQASEYQQQLALQKIDEMNKTEKPSKAFEVFLYTLGGLLALALFYVFVRHFVFALLKVDANTHKARFAVLLTFPAAILLFGTVIYPFFYNILISFSNMNMTNVNSWSLIGFKQYEQVLLEPTFYSVLGKTVIWTVVNIIFHVTIGVFLASLLNRKLWGKGIIRVLLILPWAIPQYIVALTWRGMFNSETGAINGLLNSIGLNGINWLGEPTTAFIAAIITNIWLGFPFMMVIALGAMQSIPNELYEAAEIDGATSFKKFLNVTIPMIKPVMIPAITLGIVWTFNNLNVMWLVTNGGEPADKSHILVSYVYKAAFNLYRYGYAAAFSFVIFIILVIFSISFMNKNKIAD